MRTPCIAANWKMHKTIDETMQFITNFIPLVQNTKDVEIVLAPPFTSLAVASKLLENTGIQLSAQNMHFEVKGAFTGEIAADMLVDCGCTHVILGHSERRQYFSETDEMLHNKVETAVQSGLNVIFCVGETLKEREDGKTFDVVGRALQKGLSGVDLSGLMIAYEPVWAIGTGKTATPDQAQEVHAFIRKTLAGLAKGSSDDIRILYGGSVKPDNITSLMDKDDIDGALVGGASLEPESFSNIVKFN